MNQHYPLLPLRDIVVFPGMVVPLFVGRDKSVAALEEAMSASGEDGSKDIFLLSQLDPGCDDPGMDDLYDIGTVAQVLQLLKLPDGTVRVLVEDMGDKHVMILRNHGTLAIGRSVGECFLRLYFLERACDAQVKMLSAGPGGLHNPPHGTPEKVKSQTPPAGIGMVANALAWPALLRKLDRVDPGFRG